MIIQQKDHPQFCGNNRKARIFALKADMPKRCDGVELSSFLKVSTYLIFFMFFFPSRFVLTFTVLEKNATKKNILFECSYSSRRVLPMLWLVVSNSLSVVGERTSKLKLQGHIVAILLCNGFPGHSALESYLCPNIQQKH